MKAHHKKHVKEELTETLRTMSDYENVNANFIESQMLGVDPILSLI